MYTINLSLQVTKNDETIQEVNLLHILKRKNENIYK